MIDHSSGKRVHRDTHIHTNTHTHTNTNAYKHTCKYTYCACTHKQPLPHTHTHIRTNEWCMHIRTQTLASLASRKVGVVNSFTY